MIEIDQYRLIITDRYNVYKFADELSIIFCPTVPFKLTIQLFIVSVSFVRKCGAFKDQSGILTVPFLRQVKMQTMKRIRYFSNKILHINRDLTSL